MVINPLYVEPASAPPGPIPESLVLQQGITPQKRMFRLIPALWSEVIRHSYLGPSFPRVL